MQKTLIRCFDLLFSVLGLTLGSPILLSIFVINTFNVGSPIFAQSRLGRHQRPFTVIKFRTMPVDTPWVPTHLANETAITSVSRALRKYKLDELPQLWNVLIGDMSIVGPRPCLLTQSELIRRRERLGVFKALPGITGLAQIKGIDMSQPALLAEIDAKMLEELDLTRYFRFIVLTATGIIGTRDGSSDGSKG